MNIRVTDRARSEKFYREVFGLPTSRRVVGDAYVLDLPSGGFVSLCPVSVETCGATATGRPGQIDHFCLGIQGFDATRVAERLKAAGHDAEATDGPSVWLADPDGTPIQLSAVEATFAPKR